jgi:hypothetical protein
MITVTVLAILEPQTVPAQPLSKVMNERLKRFAAELEATLATQFRDEQECEDLVVYMSYTSKYAIRWKVVNDVPARVEAEVARHCAELGYIVWKGSPVYTPKG